MAELRQAAAHQTRRRIAVGAALDFAGAILVGFAVPEINAQLALGVGLMLAGSYLVVQGVLAMSRPRVGDASGGPTASPGGNWTPEPELRLVPPRRVSLSRSGRLSVGLWIIMVVIVAVYLAAVPPRPAEIPPLLREYGASGTATVNRKAQRQTAHGQTTYYLYYNFETRDGEVLRSSQRVARATYDALSTGDELEVIYFPPEPVQHLVPRFEEKVLPDTVRWMGAALLGCLIVLFEHHRRRHRRLVSSGVAVGGVVDSVKGRGSTRTLTVRYKVHGQERTLRASERHTNRPAGSFVTVLYLPEKPQHAIVYSASLYRARET